MTNKNQSTALVPTPRLHAPAIKKSSHVATVKLVDDKTILEDKEEVRTKLPDILGSCLLYTSPSPRDRQKSRMPSSA